MAEAVFNDMLKKADWRTGSKPIRLAQEAGMSANRLMKAQGRCCLKKDKLRRPVCKADY